MNRQSEEAAFVAKLKESPTDEDTRLVFADWLEEHDDYRAPWVRDPDIWSWVQPDAKTTRLDAFIPALVRQKVRKAAQAALLKIGLPALPTLCLATRYETSEYGQEAQKVVLQIAQTTDPLLQALCAQLQARKIDVLFAALAQVPQYGEAGLVAFPHLVRLLQHPQKPVREQAVQAMTGCGRFVGEALWTAWAYVYEDLVSNRQTKLAHTIVATAEPFALQHDLALAVLTSAAANGPKSVVHASEAALLRLGAQIVPRILADVTAREDNRNMFACSRWPVELFGKMGSEFLPYAADIIRDPKAFSRLACTLTQSLLRLTRELTERQFDATVAELLVKAIAQKRTLFDVVIYAAASDQAVLRLGPGLAPLVPLLMKRLPKTNDPLTIIAVLGAIGPTASAAVRQLRRLEQAPEQHAVCRQRPLTQQRSLGKRIRDSARVALAAIGAPVVPEPEQKTRAKPQK